MLGMNFLSPQVLQSDVSKILKVQQLGARPGRPITVPITYEDMMNVESWDDSKFIFKKAIEGFPDGFTDTGGGIQMIQPTLLQ
jgi:hypothetical protein